MTTMQRIYGWFFYHDRPAMELAWSERRRRMALLHGSLEVEIWEAKRCLAQMELWEARQCQRKRK
jgi:hypothetical protein